MQPASMLAAGVTYTKKQRTKASSETARKRMASYCDIDTTSQR